MPFEFLKTDIPGVIIIRPRLFPDDRGFFTELYKKTDFVQAGISGHFVQDNFSSSRKGTLRGLHYQINPMAQAKLVRCMRGRIFDVAVDIRKGSPTYAKWIGVELSEDNNLMLYIPEGFAHGFAVLSETADVFYKCSAEYSPLHDRGILWNDPEIGIAWPIDSPVISDKDRRQPRLKDAEINFVFT